MGKNRNKKKIVEIPFRNDSIVNYESDNEENAIEDRRNNKPISIFQLNEICNEFQSKINELNDLIISEKNMKQKFLKIGKKYAFQETIEKLTDLIY